MMPDYVDIPFLIECTECHNAMVDLRPDEPETMPGMREETMKGAIIGYLEIDEDFSLSVRRRLVAMTSNLTQQEVVPRPVMAAPDEIDLSAYRARLLHAHQVTTPDGSEELIAVYRLVKRSETES